MRPSKRRIAEIQQTVLDWYAGNQRDLPWRQTHDPYKILVSEIMLQQTQVPRVIPKYEAFFERFPTISSLATATAADVIREWKGLGYNRRALNLQRAVRVVTTELNGVFPATVDGLQRLPGVGRYTAGAVMNFAFGIDTPAVDTNVRLFIDVVVPTRKSRTDREYYELAELLAPNGKPHVWLHAVMDYTSAELRSKRPKPVVKKKETERFVGSNRYLRGQILDALRIAPATQDNLFERIASKIDVPRERFHSLLKALEQEGFVARKKTALLLAE